MAQYRSPIPIELWKKLFLWALHQHRPGGVFEFKGMDYEGVIRQWIPEHFGIRNLTEDDVARAYEAIQRLQNEGLICNDPGQSSDHFKILTEKGKRIVNDNLETIKPSSIDIDLLLTRDDLKLRCRDHFVSGNYNDAILSAFKYVEEYTRTKANLPPNAIGAKLMTEAFKVGGILAHKHAKVSSEQEGLMEMMRGALRWFKNPESHRTVKYDDPNRVAQYLAFANILLDLIDECQ